MKILGATCGIGSMMVGAKKNFEVIGNIEWRSYYHTGTFDYNFPSSFMVRNWDRLTPSEKSRSMNPDILIGHPECGHYSALNTPGDKTKKDQKDIPLYIDLVKKTKPKFFVADNLPASLLSLSVKEWRETLPEYKFDFAWVSNYNYGNVQKFRNRLFIIGSKRELGFTFIPGEFHNKKTIRDVIGDLPDDEDIVDINHIHRKPDDIMTKFSGYFFGMDKPHLTFKEFYENVPDFLIGRNLCYYNKAGGFHKKPGYIMVDVDKYCNTLDGGESKYRFDTYQPLTIRERARIQGFNDDFIFYPLEEYKNSEYVNLIKQTGKCMPLQFCTYITDQIYHYLNDIPFETSGLSLLPPNPILEDQLRQFPDDYQKWI